MEFMMNIREGDMLLRPLNLRTDKEINLNNR